ncbi:unnamed protein product [Linum trigynum]|uniref:Uncharacterized protein n=1 Tax=Linum trigynum TaxID=586398 RepID=A0AAV2D5T3_9ROSI
MIRRPLWFDKSSRLGQRLGYPRVCVEMGVDSVFPDSLRLVPDRRPAYNVNIEFCNKPELCKKCSRLGHDCEKVELVTPEKEEGEMEGRMWLKKSLRMWK